MKIKHIGWILLLFIALVEGVSLLTQQLMTPLISYLSPAPLNPTRSVLAGLTTGFIGLFISILIYNGLSYKIKINNKKINTIDPLVPSLFNALFLAISFLIQLRIMRLQNYGLIGFALLGLVSIGIAAALTFFVYNQLDLKIKYNLDKKKSIIKTIPYKFALIAGFFEFFIIPLMFVFYGAGVHIFLNGFFSGLIGSFIPWIVVNQLLKRRNLF